MSQAKFADNGGCGYVLKPSWMRHRTQLHSANVRGTELLFIYVHLRLISDCRGVLGSS